MMGRATGLTHITCSSMVPKRTIVSQKHCNATQHTHTDRYSHTGHPLMHHSRSPVLPSLCTVGHSKTDMYELYIYPDTKDAQGVGVCIGKLYNSHNLKSPHLHHALRPLTHSLTLLRPSLVTCSYCSLADQAPTPGQSGWGEVWTHNRCLLYSSPIVYNIWSCDVDRLFTPLLANNTIYAPVGAGVNATFVCGRNGSDVQLSLKEWQKYGEDLGTVVLPAPEVSEIVQWIRDLLIV